MTTAGIKEYVDALRDRYSRGSKKEKGKALDEFVGVVGCHHTFTRPRSYKKNDTCYMEQKNWSVVRRIIGCDRLRLLTRACLAPS